MWSPATHLALCCCGDPRALTRLLYAPTDRGTVQKVMVLPSNGSLHEDLILEELEVFQVSSAPLPLPLPPLTLITSFSGKSQRKWGEELGQSRQWRVAFKRARSHSQVVAGATADSSHDSFDLLNATGDV